MNRKALLAALLIAVMLAGACSDGTDETSTGDGTEGEGAAPNRCVALVDMSAVSAAAVLEHRDEHGEEPTEVSDIITPEVQRAQDRLVATLPSEVIETQRALGEQDDPDQEDLRRLQEAWAVAMSGCRVGEGPEVLSAACRRDLADLQVILEDEEAPDPAEVTPQLEAFATDCVPDDDPYRAAGSACAAFAYTLVVDPDAEFDLDGGDFLVPPRGSEEADERAAARYHEMCSTLDR